LLQCGGKIKTRDAKSGALETIRTTDADRRKRAEDLSEQLSGAGGRLGSSSPVPRASECRTLSESATSECRKRSELGTLDCRKSSELHCPEGRKPSEFGTVEPRKHSEFRCPERTKKPILELLGTIGTSGINISVPVQASDAD
jgi:hypothetical protein